MDDGAVAPAADVVVVAQSVAFLPAASTNAATATRMLAVYILLQLLSCSTPVGAAIGAAPQRVEGDGQSSFRLLASEHPENTEETSYVFTRTICVV